MEAMDIQDEAEESAPKKKKKKKNKDNEWTKLGMNWTKFLLFCLTLLCFVKLQKKSNTFFH
jgi:hypothetical protein